MAISIVQKAFNSVVYQVQPLNVVLPAKTTQGSASTGSRVLVVVQGAKSGFPYPYGGATSAYQSTPGFDASTITFPPTVTDDAGNVYAQLSLASITNLQQDNYGVTGAMVPDSSGLFPSVFAYLGSSSGASGATGALSAQTVTVSAFYPDETLSPPVNGRAVFDGGMQVQVYEIGGLATGVTKTVVPTTGATGSVVPLGFAEITPPTASSLTLESLILMDSSAFTPGATASGQFRLASDSGAFLGGSSYWANVLTLQGGSATGSNGFNNPLNYMGGVIAASFK